MSDPLASLETGAASEPERWFADWQNPEHARRFDGRAALSERQLLANLEVINDVRLLRRHLSPQQAGRVLEVGCATGEMYRYLRIRFPRMTYAGLDISQPAIERARAKYPAGAFHRCEPAEPVHQALNHLGLESPFTVVYSKDVLHHQLDPWGFLEGLVAVTSELLILRTRTRDVGGTLLDPEQSCQFHYGGWMPYLVLNLEELIQRLRELCPRAHVVVLRNRKVLGGRENRYLPKACYLPETGTAETAVAVLLPPGGGSAFGGKTDRPGEVVVTDRQDEEPIYPWADRVSFGLRKLRSILKP